MKEDYTMETKIAILKSGLMKKDIAREMGIKQPNLSRLFRNGISKEKKEIIEQAILKLKGGN